MRRRSEPTNGLSIFQIADVDQCRRRARITLGNDENRASRRLSSSSPCTFTVTSTAAVLSAASVTVFIASMLLVGSAEIGRRLAERRYGREYAARVV